MRQLIFLCVLSSMFFLNSFAQIPAIQWQKTIGSSDYDYLRTNASKESRKIYLRANNGNILVAGTIGQSNGDFAGIVGTGGIFIGELDHSGNWIWKKRYGGLTNLSDEVVAVQPAIGGGYIVLGNTFSNDNDVTGNHGDSDAWVLKIDNAGAISWKKCFGGSRQDMGSHIAKVGNSGYVFIGSTFSFDGDLSGVHRQASGTVLTPYPTDSTQVDTTGQGYGAIWVVNINASGNILWSKCFGGKGFSADPNWQSNDRGVIIKPDLEGGFICGANMYSRDQEGRDNHGYSYDVWLARLSSTGDLINSKCYGGTADETLEDIEPTSDGGCVFVGSVASTNGDVSGRQGGTNDAWMVKVSKTGQIEWQKCIGGTGAESFSDVVIMPNNVYVSTGNTDSRDGDITINKGGSDLLVCKLSNSGHLLWEKTFGGSQNDQGLNILSESENEYLVYGETFSNDQDVDALQHGYCDLWLVKLGSSSRIKGTVYFDDNSNGIKETDEKWADNLMVTTSKNGHSQSASIRNGQFYLDVDTGVYATSVHRISAYFTAVPATKSSTFTSYFQSDSISFALQPIPGKKDLSINIVPLSPARPGFDISYNIYYKNTGTTFIDHVQIVLIHDNRLDFQQAFPTVTSSLGSTLNWDISGINSKDTGFISVHFKVKVPPTVNINDQLLSSLTIFPVDGDETPNDNTVKLTQVVTGSFDPNDKMESHSGKITTLEASSGEYLNYTIRFQNMGTDLAFNIKVLDTLDDKLDWNSLQMVAASHPYTFSIKEGNLLAWYFKDIQLPYKQMDEPGSNGFISYRIKPKNSLVSNEVIQNKAAIYFDYNLPVITNDVVTVVQDPSVLPLTLISFTGNYDNRKVTLRWTTVNEYNFDRFEIERSKDRRTFQKIGVKWPGSNRNQATHYIYEDDLKDLPGGVIYYRLRMTDVDGRFSFSNVIPVQSGKLQQGTHIYPNPINRSEGYLLLNAEVNGTIQINIMDVSGRLVAKQDVQVFKGVNTIPIQNLNQLKAGWYGLNVLKEGSVDKFRFMVVK